MILSSCKLEIRQRLADIDLALTSAIRDLEVDVNGDHGTDSKKVIAAAMKAIA